MSDNSNREFITRKIFIWKANAFKGIETSHRSLLQLSLFLCNVLSWQLAFTSWKSLSWSSKSYVVVFTYRKFNKSSLCAFKIEQWRKINSKFLFWNALEVCSLSKCQKVKGPKTKWTETNETDRNKTKSSTLIFDWFKHVVIWTTCRVGRTSPVTVFRLSLAMM